MTFAVSNLTLDQTDILAKLIIKIVQKITLDDSIKLNTFIPNPTQYVKFLTIANNISKVIEKARDAKKTTDNSISNDEMFRHLHTPSAPQNPQEQ